VRTPTRALASSRVVRRVLGSSVLRAATTPHGVDRYLELLDPLWSLNDIRAEVTEVRYKTADSVTLTLRPNSNWRGFRAGQFVRLTVEIDGVRRTRCYSPACSQFRADGCIELTVKVDPNGLVSRHLHTHARPGTVVHLSQAQGEFVLPLPHPRRILLISGGSGITPVMSILRTLCDEAYNGRITFLHYAFTARDVIYGTELAEIARRYPSVRIVRAYTEQVEGGELSGFFCREHLLAADPHYADAETYVCGPLPLMDSVRAFWTHEGLAERLHVEQFTAPVRTVASDEAEGEISFTLSGCQVPNSGRTLLEQAEDAGLTPEYGCRMGICFSCARRKETGLVRNVRTGEVSGEDDEEIQLCINVPVGDVALEL
jgi:stearoyl-CoA 9-desaturase NADPH oxidoreductase